MPNFKPKKIGDMRYQIDPDSSIGMKVPVTIYADEKLLTKMMTDRTIQQAVNVNTSWNSRAFNSSTRWS